MKKLRKIFAIYIILNSLTFFIFNFTNVSNASVLGDAISQAQNFIDKGKAETNDMDSEKVTNTITENVVGIGQILTFVGIGVLICVTTYMGILFIISPPEKQGEIKEKLVGLAVATIVIFGAWGIWKIALNIFSKFD